MLLPAVLEIYIVWHPGDDAGREIAETFIAHFHGDRFTGLLGGAIEVYVRSQGWRGAGDSPRPITLPGIALPGGATPSGIPPARFVAIVPLLGNELAYAFENPCDPWRAWLDSLVAAEAAGKGRIDIYPLPIDAQATSDTALGALFNRFQQLARPDSTSLPESEGELRCRDLSQALAQRLSGPGVRSRITVFISHTKRATGEDEHELAGLVDAVRRIIASTRLAAFFDANDLQPGEDWDRHLRQAAGNGALLALRTDRYASRDWCQREMSIAKREGMPIVILDALTRGEERGSFLLDHVPRMRIRAEDGAADFCGIRRGLNLLVDECLKQALWRQQKALARESGALDVSWWAPHAPEPVTLAHWLATEGAAIRAAGHRDSILILHPDPPLTREEQAALNGMADLAGINARLDLLTPRMLAARGGGVAHG